MSDEKRSAKTGNADSHWCESVRNYCAVKGNNIELRAEVEQLKAEVADEQEQHRLGVLNAEAQLAALREELKLLAANMQGLISIERDGIIGPVGYANVACVESNLLEARAALSAPIQPIAETPPPVCTGTGSFPVDYSPAVAQMPSTGLCGICGHRAPIRQGPEGVLSAHPYQPTATAAPSEPSYTTAQPPLANLVPCDCGCGGTTRRPPAAASTPSGEEE